MRHANRQVRIRGTNSPNIILVVSSALACSDLSCYEPACFDTPHIDNLASQGVRFTNYYAGSSEDRGSLWSLIMGLSTCRLPTGTPITLQPGSQNLAEVLWQAGYATGIIGDCSLGGILIGSAEQYGFDEWFRPGDPDRAAEPYPAYAWNNGARIRVLANANGQQGKHAADLIADETAAFLDRHSRGRPFFLLVCYPPPIADAPLPPRDAARDLAADWQIAAHQADAPGVARWDEDIGAVVERLQRLAIQHHSIIFFTSRHARRDQAPADLHERHIRVPLIVAAPGRIAGGRTSDQVCAAWDLLPTIADMVGALRRPRASDGLSIVAAIRNQTQQTHEVLAWQLAAPQGSQAIRMGTWKAIRPAGSAALQLFDLRADSAETTDVAAQHPDIVQQLESQFSSINSDQYRLPGNVSPSHDDI
jgi:arylsulfatase A-like enzyme